MYLVRPSIQMKRESSAIQAETSARLRLSSNMQRTRRDWEGSRTTAEQNWKRPKMGIDERKKCSQSNTSTEGRSPDGLVRQGVAF
jgi:hypothetical protein